MITVLLIVHALLAVFTVGALTHQALSVWWPATGQRSFFASFRAVRARSYANAIVVLYLLTATAGATLYFFFRLEVRPVLEDLRLNAALGAFELKEHSVAIGLGVLPAYWLFWRHPLLSDYAGTRKGLTTILAVIVWWSFLVGHILNNIRGFGI